MFLVFQKSKFKCLSFEELNLKFTWTQQPEHLVNLKSHLGIFFEKGL